MTVPRVLVVMPEDIPRALLRAALRELGYDAVGARSLAGAMRVRADEAGRGPVGIIVVEQRSLSGIASALWRRLVHRHGVPKTVLLARTTTTPPPGAFDRILRRPVSVADITATIETLLPLSAPFRHPIDADPS